MAVFQAALINELEKLFKKKKIVLAFSLSLALVVLSQVLILGVQAGLGIRGAGTPDFPIFILSVVLHSLLPLLLALIVIDAFSGEFSQQIIRFTLSRPISRFKLYSAKVAAIGLFLMANLLLLFLLSALCGLLMHTASISLFYLAKTLLAYLISLLPLLTLALLIVLFANFFRSGSTVFFVSILTFLLLQALQMVFPSVANLPPTAHLDWYLLWLSNNLPLDKILRSLALLLGYGLLFFTAGYALFDRREF